MIIKQDAGRTWRNLRQEADRAQSNSVLIPLLMELAKQEATNGDDKKAEKLLKVIAQVEGFQHPMAPHIVGEMVWDILRGGDI